MGEGQRMLELVMGDVTMEMLAWTPSNQAHPIGAIYAHAVGVEDLYIQQILQNKPLLWETEHWRAKLGHEVAPNQCRTYARPNFYPRIYANLHESFKL